MRAIVAPTITPVEILREEKEGKIQEAGQEMSMTFVMC
jgi:hypothetical protein